MRTPHMTMTSPIQPIRLRPANLLSACTGLLPRITLRQKKYLVKENIFYCRRCETSVSRTANQSASSQYFSWVWL